MTAPRVITFGCRLNAYESEVIKNHAAAAGLEDTVIVNTCAVTGEAMRQARQAIRRAHRKHPKRKIVVTGCGAQIDPKQFSELPGVAKVLGNAEKMAAESYRTLEGPEKIQVNDIFSVRETAGHLIDGFQGRARAFVQIQNGCDHRCTFCIIPYGRGNSRSVGIGEVIRQIGRLAENGIKEVVLTGVDLTSYGKDLPGSPTLGDLVQKILIKVPSLSRLRLSSIDAIEVDEALFEAFSEDRLMPHLHLSLQSGDNMILKRMKRRHSREDAIAFVERVRCARPETVFGADFIAGFPTETEGMFEETLRLVDECGLNFLHVFPYSARKGTPAARMPQLPVKVRKERARTLREKGAAADAALFARMAGKRARVLVEKTDQKAGVCFGHSECFAPVALEGLYRPGRIVSATLSLTSRGTLSGRPYV